MKFDFILNSLNIAKILSYNFGFEISKDPIYNDLPLLKLSAADAFSFSLVQGAPYLINPVGFSMRDRLEVFIHRSIFQNNKYIYSPGLFGRNFEGNLTAGNSPNTLFIKYPELKSNIKNIIFRSSSGNNFSNIEMQTYNELKNNGIDPKDYLIFKLSKNLTNLESFFEYLSCRMFDDYGYFTESQTPWFQQSYNGLTGGIPDYSIFYIEEFNELKKKKWLPNFMLIQNLSTIFVWKGDHKIKDIDYEFSLGEVKSSKEYTREALCQLDKYSRVELAEKLYATIYNEKSIPDDYGLFYIDDNFKIQITEPKRTRNTNKILRENDRKWILDYAKIYLISNIQFEQIKEFIIKKLNLKTDKIRSFHLLTVIRETDFEEIIDLLSSCIK